MKILREEKEILLTPAELREAFEEYQAQCRLEDAKSLYETDGVDDDDLLTEVNRAINHNDGFWEAYWSSVAMAAEELELKEREEYLQ